MSNPSCDLIDVERIDEAAEHDPVTFPECTFESGSNHVVGVCVCPDLRSLAARLLSGDADSPVYQAGFAAGVAHAHGLVPKMDDVDPAIHVGETPGP